MEVPCKAGEKWRMWYHGRSLEADPEVVPLSMGSIGLAESDDGLHWQKCRGPAASGAVFTPSKDAANFDSALVGMGSIAGNRLYYFGGSREPFAMGDRYMLGVHQSIGVAFDTGRGQWNDRREILPRGDDFDAVFAASPQVVKHSAEDWRMYYHGAGLEDKKFRIGLARSRDGLTWCRWSIRRRRMQPPPCVPRWRRVYHGLRRFVCLWSRFWPSKVGGWHCLGEGW